MANFRDVLKPLGQHNWARARHVTGFYAALALNGKVVWTGETFRKADWGDDAREMARDAAEAVLHCADGSLTAEELQAIVDREDQHATRYL